MEELVLPTKKEAPLKEVPGSMILFGLPKAGKTTALAELPNCLNIDIEKGSGFVDAMRIQPPDDLGPVGIYNWLKKVAKSIKENRRPYDFLAIETVSYLDELAEWIGTYIYMNSVQGKKFNRDDKGDMLTPDNPDYRSVHTLPDGAGYRYSRNVMTEIFDLFKDLAKICTIFVCHVTDKFVLSKATNKEVRAIDLSLTGKVRNIYSRDVDAIAYVYQRSGKLNISFKGDEERVGGIRGSQHLQGFEGDLNWKEIFKLK